MSVFPSIRAPICPSVRRCVRSSVRPSVLPLVQPTLFISLFIHLRVSLFLLPCPSDNDRMGRRRQPPRRNRRLLCAGKDCRAATPSVLLPTPSSLFPPSRPPPGPFSAPSRLFFFLRTSAATVDPYSTVLFVFAFQCHHTTSIGPPTDRPTDRPTRRAAAAMNAAVSTRDPRPQSATSRQLAHTDIIPIQMQQQHQPAAAAASTSVATEVALYEQQQIAVAAAEAAAAPL